MLANDTVLNDYGGIITTKNIKINGKTVNNILINDEYGQHYGCTRIVANNATVYEKTVAVHTSLQNSPRIKDTEYAYKYADVTASPSFNNIKSGDRTTISLTLPDVLWEQSASGSGFSFGDRVASWSYEILIDEELTFCEYGIYSGTKTFTVMPYYSVDIYVYCDSL